jgi:DNA-directed RNA polymerase specialized sigma24 family protein
MRSLEADAERAVGALYASSYRRLVGVVGAVGGDRQEAEEAVQDAFVRLLDRWSQVSRYDDPEAWVRKVALGKLSNRRRKLRNGLAAARRHGPAPTSRARAATPSTSGVRWPHCRPRSAPSWSCRTWAAGRGGRRRARRARGHR